MKRICFVSMLATVLLCSCTSTQTLTSSQIQMMTTKQYEEGYDIVYSSIISLLQAEGFLVKNTDKETGLITASKQIDNKNAGLSLAFFGMAKMASTSDVSFFVQKLNDNLTEVKITIYEGSVNAGGYRAPQQNSMVQDSEIYTTWFKNLRVEIDRRKALMGA